MQNYLHCKGDIQTHLLRFSLKVESRKELLLILDVPILYYRGMCCTWTCQQNRDLHLDVSGQKEHVLA